MNAHTYRDTMNVTRSLSRSIMTVVILGFLMTSCGGGSGGGINAGNGGNNNSIGGGGTIAPTGVPVGSGLFSLSSPANNATNVSTLPTLVWTVSSGASAYNIQLKIAAENNYTQLASVTPLTTNYQVLSALSPNTTYNWQVIAISTTGSLTAGPRTFTTGNGTATGASTVELVPCPTSTTTSVSIQNFAFIPASITVPIGTVVQWTNLDTTTHTVTATTTPSNGSFDSSVNPGASVCLRFTSAGSYSYHCTIHPFMTGAVAVQ
jgi:plastocyanin